MLKKGKGLKWEMVRDDKNAHIEYTTTVYGGKGYRFYHRFRGWITGMCTLRSKDSHRRYDPVIHFRISGSGEDVYINLGLVTQIIAL